MEWDFNIENWANVEVNSSQEQRSLRRHKQMRFRLRLYQRKDFCKTSSLSSQQHRKRLTRQALQRHWRYWGRTPSTPIDRQEIQGHTREETKLWCNTRVSRCHIHLHHPTVTKQPYRRHHLIQFPYMFPSKPSQTIIYVPPQKTPQVTIRYLSPLLQPWRM